VKKRGKRRKIPNIFPKGPTEQGQTTTGNWEKSNKNIVNQWKNQRPNRPCATDGRDQTGGIGGKEKGPKLKGRKSHAPSLSSGRSPR